MIEIPITVAILVMGVLFLQHNHHRFLEDQKMKEQIDVPLEKVAELMKEFEDYKKRVDTLMIRAGFKL